MGMYRVVSTSLEVHIDFILRDTTGHQLTITTEDISTAGPNADAIAFQTVCHLCPIVFLRGHDIHGFAHNGKTN